TSLIDAVGGGLMFWVVGLPAPLLWGVVIFVLSFLPVVGAGWSGGPRRSISRCPDAGPPPPPCWRGAWWRSASSTRSSTAACPGATAVEIQDERRVRWDCSLWSAAARRRFCLIRGRP